MTFGAMKIIDTFQWYMSHILIRNQFRLKKTSEAVAFTVTEIITTEWLTTTYGVKPTGLFVPKSLFREQK